MTKVLITNIGLLASPHGTSALGGNAQAQVRKVNNAHVLAEEGRITHVGTGQIGRGLTKGAIVVDAGGNLVTPGLVDAHTHLVFGGWRAHELPMKLAGVPYLQILAEGGGILSTVRETRAASPEALKQKAQAALGEMLCLGTTTCEAKSGYGLNLKDEIKQLEVAQALNDIQPVHLVSTLMAAHAVPEECRDDRRAYIDLVIEEIIPAATECRLASYCDIFCESGVFSADESREILLAARKFGLGLKIHADELGAIGGSELAGELGAVSAEHLIAIKKSGISALAKGGVIACLLPATSFYLDKPYAPARELITAGVPVAVASDFNPGSCPGLNLQLCINLSCLKYKMAPEEVLTAVTLNAAAAIGLSHDIGSIEPGKQADLVIWDSPDLDFLCYRFGSNLARTVIKKGRVVADH
ncbi:MAG: imidazolonepropionase [Eubacteriales bacterium]|nr:imidazolonepropionase [Eubacteriales bacterium]